MKKKRIVYEDVAYDTRGMPHSRDRRGVISPKGKLKPTRGVSRLPKGWSWKKKKR